MFTLIWIILAGVLVLAGSELIRRRLGVANENARKTYHVVHALIFSAAPFLVSYNIIIGLEVLILLEILAVKKFNLLPWLYNVGRISWGEYFGIAAVIALALIEPNKWVFLAAMLHLGIADAAAAVVGTRYGRRHQFKVFGQTKSLQGSLAFFVASLGLTTLVILVSNSTSDSMLLIALLPLITTAAETVSPYGVDNFVIPLLVVMVLNSLRFAA